MSNLAALVEARKKLAQAGSDDFDPPTDYDEVSVIEVNVTGKKDTPMEEVFIDPLDGPLILKEDGSIIPMGKLPPNSLGINGICERPPKAKSWLEMTKTEQTVWIHLAAKKNKALKARFPGLMDDATP
mmetsp:Transcript_28727/g.61004  ORF Transcript_28727/g.61004 Transcript_28727/m.61004 type:complete len:128 (+) Transcript_28727:106-489(+)